MSDASGPGSLMIVDDTPAMLELLCRLLEGQGYRVRAASSGGSALASARLEPPDLFLLDVMMPGMNGYELCEQLKADPSMRDVPVIFLSALGEAVDRLRGLRAGAVDYVTKPFDAEEIQTRIGTHMQLRRLSRRLETQNAELQVTCERLREAEKARDNLTDMLIHDLRNPLASIFGFLRLIELRGGGLTPDLQECVRISLRSTTDLIEMVSSLLDVNKMEAGALKLELAACDMGDVVREVIDRTSPFLERRRLLLEEARGPLVVNGDRGLLQRVVTNLVSNALKFVPASGGEVRLRLEGSEGGVRVATIDNGLGIPLEYHDKIFDKFGQVELRSHRRKYSTGLGLWFCKLAVEAHGGVIGVDSEPNRGSTFWFFLPPFDGWGSMS